MKEKPQSGGTIDTAKLAAAALLVISGLYGFYYFSAYNDLLRVIGLLLFVGAAAAIALTTAQGKQLWGFVRDARNEVRKVVWPTRQETVQTTLVVVVMVIILGLILWGFDSVLTAILRFLTNQGT